MTLPLAIRTIHERASSGQPGRRIRLVFEAYRFAPDKEAFALALIGELVTLKMRLEQEARP